MPSSPPRRQGAAAAARQVVLAREQEVQQHWGEEQGVEQRLQRVQVAEEPTSQLTTALVSRRLQRGVGSPSDSAAPRLRPRQQAQGVRRLHTVTVTGFTRRAGKESELHTWGERSWREDGQQRRLWQGELVVKYHGCCAGNVLRGLRH